MTLPSSDPSLCLTCTPFNIIAAFMKNYRVGHGSYLVEYKPHIPQHYTANSLTQLPWIHFTRQLSRKRLIQHHRSLKSFNIHCWQYFFHSDTALTPLLFFMQLLYRLSYCVSFYKAGNLWPKHFTFPTSVQGMIDRKDRFSLKQPLEMSCVCHKR